MDEIKMRVSGVEKSFPGVKALSGIDFAVRNEPFMRCVEKTERGNLH